MKRMKKEINVLNDCRGLFAQEIIESIMQSRGIKNVEKFLNPTLDEYMIPFDDLKNIDKAADIFINGLKEGGLFGIYADV